MTKVVTSTGLGAAISESQNDSNLSSMSGKNSLESGTTHTIDINDQNDTIEYTNASLVTITLPTISTVTGANLDTDDFKVLIKSVGAGGVTINRSSTDTFDDGTTSKTLPQYSRILLQTDSTLGKWNIIGSGDSVASLGTSEALKSVTANSSGEVGIGKAPVTNMDLAIPTIQASTGILFGSETSAANTLDDYRTGTWTPTIQDLSFSDGEGQTYSSQIGSYVKIGSLVYAYFSITLTSLGTLTTSNVAVIAGLPFTTSATNSGSVTITSASNITITAGESITGTTILNGTTSALNSWSSTTGTDAFNISKLTNSSILLGVITYDTL